MSEPTTEPVAPSPGAGERSAQRQAYVALALMVSLWAVNFSVAKVALDTLAPLAFNALRYPLAALVVFVALWRGGALPTPRREDWRRLLLLGLTGNLAYQLCFIYGLALTNAGTASVLLAGTPIVTALLSHVAGHERVTGRTWIGAVATVTGIALVVSGAAAGTPAGGRSALGALLMIAASCAWAAYTVGSRPLIARYGSVPVTAWTLWIGTSALVLIGIPDVLRTDLGALPSAIWLAIVYAGALSIGVAYLIWYNAVRHLGNTRTGVFSNLVPAVALLVAWLWLGEVPTLGQMVGAAIIIAGVTAAQHRPSARGPARP